MLDRIGRWRVDLLTALPMLVIALPCFGLLLLPIFPTLSPFPLGPTPSFIPFILCAVFAALFVWSMLMTLAQLARRSPTITAKPAGAEAPPQLLMIAALMTFAVMLTQVDIFSLLAGNIYKGDLRVNGELRAFLTKFMMPALFAYTCLIWRNQRSNMRGLSVLIVGSMTFLSAFLLGTKAGSLIAILPGVIVLFWRGMSTRTFLAMALAGFAAILLASSLFDVSERGLLSSLGYVLKRTFLLTAEIPYRLTTAELAGDSGIDYSRTLMAILTNVVLRQIIASPLDLYAYSFSGAVSGLFYPELIPKISSGEWNHTPPVFSEGIVAFGPFFGLMALIAGGIGGAIIHGIRRSAAKGNYILTSLMLTYFVFVYIAWLNSAGVAGLAHPFPLLALIVTGLTILTLRSLGRWLYHNKQGEMG